MSSVRRWVVHLDLDSFFASAEQLTRPTLRGRAVLVGGMGPRGIVAGASGEAKVSGARSAMPMAQARRSCPHAVALPPRTAVYRTLSETFFAVVRSRAPVLEQVAYDETFAEPVALAGAAEDDVRAWAEEVRAEVREKTGLAVSVGAGSGKQVAKIASGLAKPDGVHVVAHGGERELLDPLPVRALWGIGPVAETTLARAGVTTVAALAALELGEVTALLGSAVGTGLHRLARGIDDRAVTERGEAKQVSAETTFDTDLSDVVAVRRAVAELAGSAHRRLVASRRAARTVTVKVRGGDFATHTRSETTAVASTDLPTLTETAQRLAVAALPDAGVRLVGVSYAGLTTEVQGSLFDDGVDRLVEDPAPVEDPDTGALRPVVTSEALPDDDRLAGEEPDAAADPERAWRTGDDVAHPEHGHGWVQGAGHGRVTVRFETRSTGPGRAVTFASEDPELSRADPLASLS
ncbi:DNA polymerase IV [Actinomycetospora endophytica]|uniref:DNA polymerase IV n=1 Tax=Actinomycetospora endophytica TaxID=2291215 RepID=A0ABS8PA82_9PSEU|nr:DNA polymerase IV [Actinomycetospora endophytica]MCD2193899.1 DNA polymerase IV [Actinomycetospora endophytica]